MTLSIEHKSHLTRCDRAVEMTYLLKDDQLLLIWSAIRYLTKIRELNDVIEQGIALTEAQALLVAFVFQLEPLSRDSASPFEDEPPARVVTGPHRTP
jgi:hypothetical protein